VVAESCTTPLASQSEVEWYNVASERKGGLRMARTKGSAKIETVARKAGIPENAFRNPDGRKTRKDKRLRTVRKEHKGK
jgi:hypothetical protein